MRKTSQIVIKKLILRRKTGATVPELVREFKLGKATIWRHVSRVELSPKVKRGIQSRRGGSRVRKEERILAAEREAKALLSDSFDIKCAPLILSALYWAEGSKGAFVFTNTDPNMIRLVVGILKNEFDVRPNCFQILIRVHKKRLAKISVHYWASVVGVPVSKIKVNINHRHNKTVATYGLCRLTIARGAQLLKVVTALNIKLTEAMFNAYNRTSGPCSLMDRALHS